MKKNKDIKNLIQQFDVDINCETDLKILDELKKQCDGLQSQNPHTRKTGRIIMLNRMLKLSAAAALLVVIGVLSIQLTNKKEVAVIIPPELANKSVKEIMSIQSDLLEAPYTEEIITLAMKNALDKLSAREVLELARQSENRRFAESAEVAGYPYNQPKPVTEVIEVSDMVVQVFVNKVELDVSDLKKAMVEEKNLYREEHFSSNIRSEVEVEVLDVYPPDALKINSTIKLFPVINTRNLDRIKEGSECVMVLKQNGDTLWLRPYQEGVYPIDVESGMVEGFRAGPIALDKVWYFMVSTFNTIHNVLEPSVEDIEYWMEMNQSDELSDCRLAVEYFSTLKNTGDIGDIIVNAIKSHHLVDVEYHENTLPKYTYNLFEIQKNIGFVTDAMDLLINMNDVRGLEEVLQLAEESVSEYSVFNKALFEYPTRMLQEKITQAERKLKYYAEPDFNNMAETVVQGHDEAMAYAFETYYNDPSESNINLVFNTMREYLRPEDKEYVPFLMEHINDHWTAPVLIARLGDPEFVPVILESLQDEVTGEMLDALAACGEKEQAVDIAIAKLLSQVKVTDFNTFNKELRRRSPIIKFLGTCGDKAALKAIEYYLDEDVLGEFYRVNVDLGGSYVFQIDDLRYNSILALARLGGKKAIPQLKKQYASDDIHVRILAALGLYYNGNNTGYELLNYFVTNTHRSVPDIEIRWHYDLASNTFQSAAKYLRSERIDGLILEKIRSGVEAGDGDYIKDEAFYETHRDEVLAILVDQLDSRDRETRYNAYDVLVDLVRPDVDIVFDGGRLAGHQEDVVEMWRQYVKSGQ